MRNEWKNGETVKARNNLAFFISNFLYIKEKVFYVYEI